MNTSTATNTSTGAVRVAAGAASHIPTPLLLHPGNNHYLNSVVEGGGEDEEDFPRTHDSRRKHNSHPGLWREFSSEKPHAEREEWVTQCSGRHAQERDGESVTPTTHGSSSDSGVVSGVLWQVDIGDTSVWTIIGSDQVGYNLTIPPVLFNNQNTPGASHTLPAEAPRAGHAFSAVKEARQDEGLALFRRVDELLEFMSSHNRQSELNAAKCCDAAHVGMRRYWASFPRALITTKKWAVSDFNIRAKYCVMVNGQSDHPHQVHDLTRGSLEDNLTMRATGTSKSKAREPEANILKQKYTTATMTLSPGPTKTAKPIMLPPRQHQPLRLVTLKAWSTEATRASPWKTNPLTAKTTGIAATWPMCHPRPMRRSFWNEEGCVGWFFFSAYTRHTCGAALHREEAAAAAEGDMDTEAVADVFKNILCMMYTTDLRCDIYLCLGVMRECHYFCEFPVLSEGGGLKGAGSVDGLMVLMAPSARHGVD
ncbi:hypothetical protein B0H12DRAFT_1077959 [Mycena haematopus]|nr:hypothetical protein B0H12DRAFT_1077959 [Mycena haematopus]